MMRCSEKVILTIAAILLALLLPLVHGECALQCANGGTCAIDAQDDTEFCFCVPPFEGELCEIESVPSCSICSDGTQSYNTDKYIPYLDMTCLELELFAMAHADIEERCLLARQTESWCECPGAAPTCSFCPNGMFPVNANLKVPDENGFSCSDFVFFAAIVPEGPDCDSFDFLVELCGGCDIPMPSSSPSSLSSTPTFTTTETFAPSAAPSSSMEPSSSTIISSAPSITGLSESPSVHPTKTMTPTIISHSTMPSMTKEPTSAETPAINKPSSVEPSQYPTLLLEDNLRAPISNSSGASEFISSKVICISVMFLFCSLGFVVELLEIVLLWY